MDFFPGQRGAVNIRVVVYAILAASALLMAYAVFAVWPKTPASDLALIDAAGHRRLAELRAPHARMPRSFIPPMPPVTPALPDDISALRRLAVAGNTDAQCKLGIKYEHGEDVAQDGREARMWFTEGAQKHNPCAINGLGNLFETGVGVNADPVAALSYYRAAAALRYPGAFFNLGRAFEKAGRCFRMTGLRSSGT
jgi:TPR repeat protein